MADDSPTLTPPKSPISPSISIENDLATLSLSSETNNCDDRIALEEVENEQIDDDGSDNDDEENVEECGEKKEIDDRNDNDNDNDNEDGDGDGSEKRCKLPLREGAEDCAFYMRTRLCKFGVYCKFNHPPLPKFPQSVKAKGKEDSCDTALENVREMDDSTDKGFRYSCKYFDRPGGCKFGEACKFNHSKKTTASSELNFIGLPIRLGEKECPYYMRNGSCKFGASCRFNHPDPASVGGALSNYGNGGNMSSPNASQSTPRSWSPPIALNENPAYLPPMFSPTQHVPPRPEWTGYQAPVYPPRTMHTAPTYMNRQPSERILYSHQQERNLVDEFPERPGQPECSYFLKTGDCKYRSACKFHHPRNGPQNTPFSLSELGLPLRPGESICSYYSRYGICKYGPSCKYDHPANYAPSAIDMTPSFCHSMINNHAMAAGS
ncbi:hypothetical protein vseg_010327 [Gypsophila vaccaria]